MPVGHAADELVPIVQLRDDEWGGQLLYLPLGDAGPLSADETALRSSGRVWAIRLGLLAREQPPGDTRGGGQAATRPRAYPAFTQITCSPTVSLVSSMTRLKNHPCAPGLDHPFLGDWLSEE